MRGLGLLATLFLAVMLANACMTVIFLLAVLGLVVGLFTNTAETLSLIGGAVLLWLIGEYPIAVGVIIGLCLIAKLMDGPAQK